MPTVLTRTPPRDLPDTALTEEIRFSHGRVHEICGPARRHLAVMLIARLSGPVIWIRPGWERDRLCACGLAAETNPGRIIFIDVKRAEDAQWCAEEVLRSGAAPAMVMEVMEPPGLTPVRRLHLAAEAAVNPVLALMLTPAQGGAQGVETRWHIAPAHGPDLTQWALMRMRARLAPPAAMTLSQGEDGLRVI